jgi:hypothetical protein
MMIYFWHDEHGWYWGDCNWAGPFPSYQEALRHYYRSGIAKDKIMEGTIIQ